MTGLNRRTFLFRTASLGIASFAIARPSRAADACVQPDSESLRASLNYAGTGADPAATCSHCAFFMADSAGSACGACQILGGPVDAAGHCDSFSPPA